MTMAPKKQLEMLQRLWDFFRKNPQGTTYQASKSLGLTESTARYWIAKLVASGHLVSVGGGESTKGYIAEPRRYKVTTLTRPLEVPKNRPYCMSNNPRRQPSEFHRLIVKAKQIGVIPDPFALPRSFFGPARAEVQA